MLRARLAAGAAVWILGGTPVLAAVGFLGTGGGQWQLAVPEGSASGGDRQRFQPVRCGAGPCILDIRIVGATDTTDPQRILYRTGFPVQGRSNLARCNGVTGTVDGSRIQLGRCGIGEFVSVNEVHLRQPGNPVPLQWVFDFVPDLATGVWVDVAEPTTRFKFERGRIANGVLTARGCEAGSGGKGAVTVSVLLSNYKAFARSPGSVTAPVLRPVTTVRSLIRADGRAMAGGFASVSSLELQGGGRVLKLERRNLPGRC